jgi:hypothetical protein
LSGAQYIAITNGSFSAEALLQITTSSKTQPHADLVEDSQVYGTNRGQTVGQRVKRSVAEIAALSDLLLDSKDNHLTGQAPKQATSTHTGLDTLVHATAEPAGAGKL